MPRLAVIWIVVASAAGARRAEATPPPGPPADRAVMPTLLWLCPLAPYGREDPSCVQAAARCQGLSRSPGSDPAEQAFCGELAARAARPPAEAQRAMVEHCRHEPGGAGCNELRAACPGWDAAQHTTSGFGACFDLGWAHDAPNHPHQTGAAALGFAVRVTQIGDATKVGDTSRIYQAALGMTGFGGRLGFSFEAALGAGEAGGFAYDGALMVGPGVGHGPVWLAALGGIGLSGISGHMARALTLDAELAALVTARWTGVARVGWVLPASSADGYQTRQHGSGLGLGDELLVTARYFGGRLAHTTVGGKLRPGWYVGIGLARALHTSFVSFEVGFGSSGKL